MPLERIIALMTGLLFGVALLTTLAKRFQLPYPSLLVLGGLALALVPGFPAIEVPPDVFLLVFLPPLIFSAGWRTSLHDLRVNGGTIALLALGLVLTTTLGIGAALHAMAPGLPWSACFTLGAIVSPTDALAANAIAGKLRLPHRLVSVLEGESLANDATGLVVYRFAVAAAITGVFSPGRAAVSLVLVSAGGAAVGLVVGFLSGRLQSLLDDAPVEIAIQLVTAYAAYLPAEHFGLSGVFAAAVAGVYGGRISPAVQGSRTRLESSAFWDTLDYLLNGVLFLLLGVQVRSLLFGGDLGPSGELFADALLIVAAVVFLRMAWVFVAGALGGLAGKRLDAKATTVLGWAGLRGVLSLVTALALPLHLDTGAPFPGRRLIVLLACAVIVGTLVIQGLSLPALIRWLRLPGDDAIRTAEQREARLAALRAAHARLDAFEPEASSAGQAAAAELRRRLESQIERLAVEAPDPGIAPHDDSLQHQPAFARMRKVLILAERRELLRLRDLGRLDDHSLRSIERDLDLEEQRL